EKRVPLWSALFCFDAVLRSGPGGTMSLKALLPNSAFGHRIVEAKVSRGFDDVAPRMGQQLERVMQAFGDRTPALGHMPGMGAGLNVRESDDGIEIEGLFTGYSEADIHVTLAGAVLKIETNQKNETESDIGNRHSVERFVSRFAQSVNLSFQPDPN